MGIQSFNFPADPIFHNLEVPIIVIANKHKKIRGAVAIYDNLKLTCNLNAFQTAEFKIYRDLNGERQDYFEYFEEGMLIMIPGISWYEIHVETNIDYTGITKSISATSLECKLCDKKLVNFQVNSDDFEDDDYVVTKFYNPTDPKKSLLTRILNVTPNWTVGHVDASLVDKQRTFDVNDVNVYSFLTEDVAEAFNCLFVFDTFNQTVNAYDLDDYGNDTNIFVSTHNLAQNMTETIDQRSIITCYRVRGGDSVEIAEVNPNGTDKIYNFEYYLPQMPEALQTKVAEYNDLYQKLKPQYEDVVARMQTQLEKIQELYDRVPDSFTSTDWTQYGLSFLQSKEKSYETQDELYCAQGMNNPQSLSYNLYKANLELLNSVKAEIAVRESEIETAENEYKSTCNELTTIQNQLSMAKWFTEEEWKILDSYVIEETYSNDNFSIADNTSDAELFSVEKELYEAAWKDLEKKCRPQYQYSATLANLLQIPEFECFKEKFELGNFIRMETDYDTIVKLRLISFTVDYTDTATIDVTFSDAVRVKDVYEDTASILGQANSLASSFKFNKDQYDNSVKQGNWVAEMRKYGLDVATTQIYNATDQSQTWDSTGMTFRKWNDERQDYDPEMIKIINNMMVFLDQNGARMAIGKISLPNGNSCYGINCELLANKLTMSENVWIENDSGTYKFDDSGFSASNGTNTVKIQPGNSGEMLSIYKGNDKQFYITSDGDVEFSGNLKSATGTFSGLISGGSINIGNNTFMVDKDGNMYASNCTISGNIQSSNINGATISGGTISGAIITSGTIYIENGGKVGDFTISDGELSYGNFGFFSDTAEFMIMSPKGKVGTIYLDATNYVYSKTWAFASTGFGVTIDGHVYANSMNVLNCNGLVPNAVPNVSWIKNNIISQKTPTSTATTDADKEIAPSYYACAGMIDNIKTWVKGVVPDTSNFATQSDLSNYSPTGHTHNQYVSNVSVSSASSTGTKFVHDASISGNTLYLTRYVYSASDVRLKQNISDLPDLTQIYMKLEPKKFKYSDVLKGYSKDWKFGLIAQDMERLFYEANIPIEETGLITLEQSDPVFNEDKLVGNDVVHRINYDQFHVMHIQMIQKQQEEIDGLQNEVNDLKQEVADLKELVNKLLERDSV